MVIGLDGNWKISRNKCLYHKKVVLTEFHPIRTGCQDTTNRKGYFCKNHKNKDLKFNHGAETTCFHPNSICRNTLSIKFKSIFSS
jgi:hypothetical protein